MDIVNHLLTFCSLIFMTSLRTADVSPRETSLSGDERGETSAVRRLLHDKRRKVTDHLRWVLRWFYLGQEPVSLMSFTGQHTLTVQFLAQEIAII